jgi:lipopolysaccharide transport system ATP-binding protein
MKAAIEISALAKSYRLGTGWRQGRTLRESLMSTAAAPWRTLRRLAGKGRADGGAGEREFWALRDVSFDVQPGEVVGIVGRNGAGKSTLLKILSRVTEPTDGEAVLRGRVGSLLEVGTGFHQELTGRENIFLNGAILGMSRREIARRFDEIVAFAEVERFLDTPVKRYSSGMYVRLAFAVAAHLEPEILIVDEVLAVGDLQFQKKCLGQMGKVARSGRTVLFVSHNMAAVQNLCHKAVLLEQGRLRKAGDCADVLAAYLRAGGGAEERRPLAACRGPHNTPIIQDVTILDGDGNETNQVYTGGAVTIVIHYDSPVPLPTPIFGVFVVGMNGEPLFHPQTRAQHPAILSLPERGVARCHIPCLPLMPGTYSLSFMCSTIHTEGYLDFLDRARTLEVEEADFFGTGQLPPKRHGPFLVPGSWSFQPGGPDGPAPENGLAVRGPCMGAQR